MARILVRGAGDVGSAVALRLRAAGHAVVLHDGERPPHPRRGMAFTDAFFDGSCTLEGVFAKRASGVASLAKMLACGGALPVSDAPLTEVIPAVSPDVLVDARMRKHGEPESLRGQTPVSIGLGPGFSAGRNADLVVETSWGEALGKVIHHGPARDPSGEPKPLGGSGRERFVYAPVAGILRTQHGIGSSVHEGEEVARIAGTPMLAPLAGILRGLTHDGANVTVGAKIVEVDPRGNPAAAFGIAERPEAIASGVVAAVDHVLRTS